eukprot:g395.t1
MPLIKNPYFDIDEILAEDEHISVQFRDDAKGLGYLLSGSIERDLKADESVQVPIWCAEKILPFGVADLDTPRFFSSRFISNLEADPPSTDLKVQSSIYFDLAMRMAPFIFETGQLEERRFFADSLSSALYQRLITIIDVARHSHREDTSEFTRRLTQLESRLFIAGCSSSQRFRRWKQRDLRLRPSKLVTIAERRRKRMRLSR